jgi:hypothetical protein
LTQNTPIYTKKYHEIYTQKIIMKFWRKTLQFTHKK